MWKSENSKFSEGTLCPYGFTVSLNYFVKNAESNTHFNIFTPEGSCYHSGMPLRIQGIDSVYCGIMYKTTTETGLVFDRKTLADVRWVLRYWKLMRDVI